MTQDEFIYDVIVGIVAFAGAFFLLILLVRTNYALRVRWRERIRQSVQEWLPKYVFGDSATSVEALRVFKGMIVSKHAANILLDEITVVYTEFSGEVADKIQALFMELKLYKIGLQNLKSPAWYLKKRGLLQLSLMQYQEAYPRIAKLRAHRDKDIRRKARIASIRLRKKQALMELKDERGAISRWALISITSILDRQSEQLHDSEIEALRSAKNKYIRTLVPFFTNKSSMPHGK